ncbi:MAG: oligoribonuclease [Planctomycetes bacterium]|nr:oligoribonuclease [Planctomycetota bacterium]
MSPSTPAPEIQRLASKENLVWIDLEMTGLDVEREVILQAALIVTDKELRPLERWVGDLWQPEAALEHMTPFVRDMHEKNGLLERCRRSRLDLRQAEQELLKRVAGWCSYPALLAGSSVGHDKRFLERYMPGLASYLSYRVLDVTTLKLLARAWYGEGAVFQKPKEREHDALFDITNSIAELAHYRATLFRS